MSDPLPRSPEPRPSAGSTAGRAAHLALRDVRKRYPGGRVALDGVTVSIGAGELVAVTGRSGSGKSTLLHVAGALDRDFEGEVSVLGRPLRALSDAEAAALRHASIGYVFQAFHLVASWTVRQNVALPASFAPAAVPDLAARVDRWIERVGLAGRGDDLPTALSGGQRQRVAIARALLMEPGVLLCDEPTGSLDAETGASILGLFRSLHEERAMTVLLVTHEARATAIATRVLTLDEGRVVDDVAQSPGAA